MNKVLPDNATMEALAYRELIVGNTECFVADQIQVIMRDKNVFSTMSRETDKHFYPRLYQVPSEDCFNS